MEYFDWEITGATVTYNPPPNPRLSRYALAVRRQHKNNNHKDCRHDDFEVKQQQAQDEYEEYLATGEFEAKYGYH